MNVHFQELAQSDYLNGWSVVSLDDNDAVVASLIEEVNSSIGEQGELSALRALRDHGVMINENEFVNQTGVSFHYAVLKAIKNERIEVLQFFLDSNPYIMTLAEVVKVAIDEELIQVLKWSLKRLGGDVNYVFKSVLEGNWTVGTRAVFEYKMKVLEFLFQQDEFDPSLPGIDGRNVGSMAVYQGCNQVMEYVLSQPRFNPYAIDQNGDSFFSLAQAFEEEGLCKRIEEKNYAFAHKVSVRTAPRALDLICCFLRRA